MERSFQYVQRMRMSGANIVWALEDTGISWKQACNDLKFVVFIRSWNEKKPVRFPF